MLNILGNKTLSVIMNKDMPWVLKPWHIKASFRKCGYHVPEEAITMPEKPIEGPNMDIENKEFFITVTVSIYTHIIKKLFSLHCQSVFLVNHFLFPSVTVLLFLNASPFNPTV